MESQNGLELMKEEIPIDSGDSTLLESEPCCTALSLETNSTRELHSDPNRIIHVASSSDDLARFPSETCIPLCPACIIINGPISFILPDNVSPSTVYVSPYGDNTIVYVPLSPAEFVKQNNN